MTAPQRPIDLRSDTVTKPTDAMRRAMAAAEVGDDVYGEDPTVRRLEEVVAEILGKEGSLFVPSGTMANQIALQLHCRPGDEVLCGRGSHVCHYECGAGAAYAGVQFVEIGTGLFTSEACDNAVRPPGPHLARTRLVIVENSHNHAGGLVWRPEQLHDIAKVVSSRGLASHLDGARVWNAAIRVGCSEAELAAPFDTVTACFSKGLGAPVGSVLAGSASAITEGRHLRRRLGGGMRQAGVLAAAALHALQHHRSRLAADHDNAHALAHRLASVNGLRCDPDAVETNIVLFESENMRASAFCERAASAGVLLHPVEMHTVRAVTHLDVEGNDIQRAANQLAAVVG